MKAIVYTQAGTKDVFQLKDVPTPTPTDDEVLIKVYATSLNPLDWKTMRVPPFLRLISARLLTTKSKILGCDVAGRVEAVGRNAKQFQPGNEVFGTKGFSGGGCAEYVCAGQDKLVLKPANISFEDAAAVPVAALTALQGLRD
jgi:NADPH:quinone reductase-like Zn-dependent oxidoreductase